MEIVAARPDHVETAVSCLVEAFANDPHMKYFFPGEPQHREDLVREFFKLLMEARLALGMPILLLMYGDHIRGMVMGEDTSRPDWLPSDARKWTEFETAHDGLVERFSMCEAAKGRLEPDAPHYYLGVLGVVPGALT